MLRALSFANPRFQRSVADISDFPSQPAVAFAGRSNAGKSSAINALCGGRFARISAAPGRTRTVNLFALGPESNPKLLADLPGYGYAAVSKRERAGLTALARAFVREGVLSGLVLIVDCRRGIVEADSHLLRQYAPRRLPLIAALSKSDKLTRSALTRATTETKRQLTAAGLENAKVIPFSALKRVNLPPLRTAIAALLTKN